MRRFFFAKFNTWVIKTCFFFISSYLENIKKANIYINIKAIPKEKITVQPSVVSKGLKRSSSNAETFDIFISFVSRLYSVK